MITFLILNRKTQQQIARESKISGKILRIRKYIKVHKKKQEFTRMIESMLKNLFQKNIRKTKIQFPKQENKEID